MTSDEYKKSSDEKYLARLKTSFENEIATKFKTLGLVEPKREEQEFYGDMNGHDERQQFEELTKKLQMQITANERINRGNVQEQYEEIMANLEYPSEMIAKLLKNPLTDDRAASEAFIKAYINEVNWISSLYGVALYEYEGVISEKLENGTIDVEKLLLKKIHIQKSLEKFWEQWKIKTLGSSMTQNGITSILYIWKVKWVRRYEIQFMKILKDI